MKYPRTLAGLLAGRLAGARVGRFPGAVVDLAVVSD